MRRSPRFLFALCIIQILACCAAQADTTYTWNKNGTDWSTASNWTSSGPDWTSSDRLNDSLASFGSQSDTTNQPSVAGTIYVKGITLDNSGSSAWSINGSGTINLGSSGLTVSSGGATRSTTIAPNVVVAAEQTWNIGTGNTVTLGGALSGGYVFYKLGTGTLELSNASNTFFGVFNVWHGTLQASGSTAITNTFRSNVIALSNVFFTPGANARFGGLFGEGFVSNSSNAAYQTVLVNTSSAAWITAGSWTVSGPKTQTFTGDVSGISGAVNVNGVWSGTTDTTAGGLKISGNAALTNSGVSLNVAGGTFTIDNSGGAVADRFRDAGGVTLTGKLAYIGPSSGSSITETLGTLTAGVGLVDVTHNLGSGKTTTLNFASLNTDASNAMLRFTANGGAGVFDGSGAIIKFTSAPNQTQGIIAPNYGSNGILGKVVVTSSGVTNFATYDSTKGVIPISPTTVSGNFSGLSSGHIEVAANTTATASTASSAAGRNTVVLRNGATLDIGGSFNFGAEGFIFDGSSSASITSSGSGLIGQSPDAGSGAGSYWRHFYVTDPAGVLNVSPGFYRPSGSDSRIFKSGVGTLALTGTSNQLNYGSGSAVTLSVNQGVLRGTTTNLGGATSSGGALVSLFLDGGVLEIDGQNASSAVTFSRALVSSATSSGGIIRLSSSGGFSAYHAPQGVSITLVDSIGGSTAATLNWGNGVPNFSDGNALLFGSKYSDSHVTLTNNIKLDSGAVGAYNARQVHVYSGGGGDYATLSGVISGSTASDLLKTGAGTLELTGTNTYSGNTLLLEGTLRVSANANLGSSSNALVFRGSTLQLGGSGFSSSASRLVGLMSEGGTIDTNGYDGTIAGVLSGHGTLTKTGLGTLTLSGTNTYDGGTIVLAGKLKVSADTNLGASWGAVTLFGSTLQFGAGFTVSTIHNIGWGIGGGTLDTNGFDVTIAGEVAGGYGLTKVGGGTLTLTGTNSYANSTINAGTLKVSSDANLGTAPSLPATNITLNGGALQLGASFDPSANRIVSLGSGGGTIDTNGFNATFGSVISGTGALTKAGSGTLTLSGTNTYSGGTTLSAGTLTVNSAAGLGSATGALAVNGGTLNLYGGGATTTGSLSGSAGTINLGSGQSWTINQTSNGTYSGVIAGSGSVVLGRGSSATLTLGGSNTYTGGTYINGGTLKVSSNANLGGSSGTITFGGGNLQFATGDQFYDIFRKVYVNTACTIDTGDNHVDFESPIYGGYEVTKYGSGILHFRSSTGSSFFGNITINEGIFYGNDGNSLRSNMITLASGGSFEPYRYSSRERFGGLNGLGTVVNYTDSAFQRVLADASSSATVTSGNWTVAGPKTQTFTGDVTGLSGAVNVYGIWSGTAGTTAGGLKISGNAALTNSGVSLNVAGGTFTIDNSGGESSNRFRDAGGVTLAGKLAYIGPSSGSSITETLGTLSVGTGLVDVTHNLGSGNTTTLQFASLNTDASSAMLRFTANGGSGAFDGTGAIIKFTSEPGQTQGIIAPNYGSNGVLGKVIVTSGNVTNFATYDSTKGVIPITPTTVSGNFNDTGNGHIEVAANNTLTLTGSSGRNTVALRNGAILAMGGNNFGAEGFIFDGSGSASITSSGGLMGQSPNAGVGSGSYWHHFYVIEPAGVLNLSAGFSIPSGADSRILKSGDGTLALTGSSSQFDNLGATASILVNQGVLRGTTTNLGGGTSSGGGNTKVFFNGGVLEIDGGGAGSAVSFVRALANNATSSGGSIRFDGSGGFSAYNAPQGVNITLVDSIAGSTAATLVWGNGTPNLSDGNALLFGSSNSDSHVTLTNNIQLNDGSVGAYNARQVHVYGGASGSYATLSGNITGSLSADLLKTGAGKLELTGNNTYSGNTLIQGGTLLANNTTSGQSSTGSGTVVVMSGGTLGGSGKIGGNVFVQSGGTVAPGNSPGILTVDGDVTFTSGSAFAVQIQGSTAGTGYDQLKVTSGNVILDGTLSADFSSFTPDGTERLFIVNNTGSGTLSGTFSNYANDTVVANYGNFSWKIYYGSSADLFGGSGGNDVVLVPVPEPGSIMLVCAAAGGLGYAMRRRFRRRNQVQAAA